MATPAHHASRCVLLAERPHIAAFWGVSVLTCDGDGYGDRVRCAVDRG